MRSRGPGAGDMGTGTLIGGGRWAGAAGPAGNAGAEIGEGGRAVACNKQNNGSVFDIVTLTVQAEAMTVAAQLRTAAAWY